MDGERGRVWRRDRSAIAEHWHLLIDDEYYGTVYFSVAAHDQWYWSCFPYGPAEIGGGSGHVATREEAMASVKAVILDRGPGTDNYRRHWLDRIETLRRLDNPVGVEMAIEQLERHA